MRKDIMQLHIYCDGGARGNPGPAAIGYLVKHPPHHTIHSSKQFIGRATNNVAEYQAVIAALNWLVNNKHQFMSKISSVKFFLDSTLVAEQLKGNFKVKSPDLKPLHQKATRLFSLLNFPFSILHIPRRHNFRADALVNQALDRHFS